jgi:ribosome modulation factor
MAWKKETLVSIREDGRKAAAEGMSPAACPYVDDMTNGRLDAWVEGFRSWDATEAKGYPPDMSTH